MALVPNPEIITKQARINLLMKSADVWLNESGASAAPPAGEVLSPDDPLIVAYREDEKADRIAAFLARIDAVKVLALEIATLPPLVETPPPAPPVQPSAPTP